MTFSQHTWPKRSIERFADATGKVNLFDRKRDKVRMAAPGDAIFCVKRVWGHGAEVGFMKNIDNFQSLVDDVVAGNVTFFDQKQKENAGAFFLLWRSRADHRTAEGADPVKLNNVTGHSWLKDQQERFEKHGIWFIREDGTMPDRSLRGFRIQWEIDGGVDELASGQWGIFCAEAGEFLVPDHPGPGVFLPGETSHRLFIPITPKICLCWGLAGIASVSWRHVALINRYFNAVSHRYLFARDLAQCPLNPNAPGTATWQAA